jgi:GGDEF domain-containing protein
MYSMPCAVGVRRLSEILESLRREEFLDPTGPRFQVTFSAGVAEYPTDGEDLQTLCHAARQALSQAREAGGNRILSATGSDVSKV